MTAPIYLPGDPVIYRPEPTAPDQSAIVICGHPDGRLFIRISGVGDLLVDPARVSSATDPPS